MADKDKERYNREMSTYVPPKDGVSKESSSSSSKPAAKKAKTSSSSSKASERGMGDEIEDD